MPVYARASYTWEVFLQVVVYQNHLGLVSPVLNVILPLGSTYLCEVAFSAISIAKYRNKLDLEPDLRITLTESLKPDIIKQIQSHCSH